MAASRKIEAHWSSVVESVRVLCENNANLELNEQQKYLKYKTKVFDSEPESELSSALEEIVKHKSNVDSSRELLEGMMENINGIISVEAKKKSSEPKLKRGKSFWTSPYNVSDSISPGSEVAFKLRQRGSEDEWIQCEVTKVLGDGTKFEVRDPEPDENNNPGKSFKATWKDIILIARTDEAASLLSYPYGTKVLARYPETTTFYPAVVIGTKRDGRCRLRFDGEEEADKETEVERRLVLPYPAK